ncbi:hypothetical protein [Endozoicomonas atrinae]|uniref:hypothetical protein n=1 Tax=Endozoicomonas atrinae TaxID=1333660 RepID=UPI003AFF8B7D
MEKAWAIIIDDDQAACMMAIPRLFEQLRTLPQRSRMNATARKVNSMPADNQAVISISRVNLFLFMALFEFQTAELSFAEKISHCQHRP